jgi:hypothetical protein
MAEQDNKVEALAVHHLQDVRRRLDQIHDMTVRVVERLGRIERDLTDIKSDVILLENRSLTTATDIIGLKQSDEERRTQLASIEMLVAKIAGSLLADPATPSPDIRP